jgi:hypothetical protein
MWEAAYDWHTRLWHLPVPELKQIRTFETLHECFQYVKEWEKLRKENAWPKQ